MVLVRSDLRDVVLSLHLSRAVFQRIRMNFVWALRYPIFFSPNYVVNSELARLKSCGILCVRAAGYIKNLRGYVVISDLYVCSRQNRSEFA